MPTRHREQWPPGYLPARQQGSEVSRPDLGQDAARGGDRHGGAGTKKGAAGDGRVKLLPRGGAGDEAGRVGAVRDGQRRREQQRHPPQQREQA